MNAHLFFEYFNSWLYLVQRYKPKGIEIVIF